MIPSNHIYELRFIPEALIEWHKLDNSIRKPLAKRLRKRLDNPRIENERLSGELNSCFKVKDNKSGFRLVYVISEKERALVVIAVGKRESYAAYSAAISRLK